MTDGILPLAGSFLLKVHGNSTTVPGLTAGDWVVVRQQPAVGGDTVAVMSGGDATVTTFEQVGDSIVIGVVVAIVHPT